MFEYSLKAGLYQMQKESQLLTLCHEFVTFGNKGYVHIQIFIYTLNRFQNRCNLKFSVLYTYTFCFLIKKVMDNVMDNAFM